MARRDLSLRTTLIALLLGSVLAACFTDPLIPPAFRYACDRQADCDDGTRCVDGLCQIECTQRDFERVCNTNEHVACINGVCASLCPADGVECPAPLKCLELSVDDDTPASEDDPASTDDETPGVCGLKCNDDDRPCPEGEACVQGFCAMNCDPLAEEPCPDGFVCVLDLCIPAESSTR